MKEQYITLAKQELIQIEKRLRSTTEMADEEIRVLTKEVLFYDRYLNHFLDRDVLQISRPVYLNPKPTMMTVIQWAIIFGVGLGFVLSKSPSLLRSK